MRIDEKNRLRGITTCSKWKCCSGIEEKEEEEEKENP